MHSLGQFITFLMLIVAVCVIAVGLAWVTPLAQAQADVIRQRAIYMPPPTPTPTPVLEPAAVQAGKILLHVLLVSAGLSVLGMGLILLKPILAGRAALRAAEVRVQRLEYTARLLAEMVLARGWLTPEERLALNTADNILDYIQEKQQ